MEILNSFFVLLFFGFVIIYTWCVLCAGQSCLKHFRCFQQLIVWVINMSWHRLAKRFVRRSAAAAAAVAKKALIKQLLITKAAKDVYNTVHNSLFLLTKDFAFQNFSSFWSNLSIPLLHSRTACLPAVCVCCSAFALCWHLEQQLRTASQKHPFFSLLRILCCC